MYGLTLILVSSSRIFLFFVVSSDSRDWPAFLLAFGLGNLSDESASSSSPPPNSTNYRKEAIIVSRRLYFG